MSITRRNICWTFQLYRGSQTITGRLHGYNHLSKLAAIPIIVDLLIDRGRGEVLNVGSVCCDFGPTPDEAEHRLLDDIH